MQKSLDKLIFMFESNDIRQFWEAKNKKQQKYAKNVLQN